MINLIFPTECYYLTQPQNFHKEVQKIENDYLKSLTDSERILLLEAIELQYGNSFWAEKYLEVSEILEKIGFSLNETIMKYRLHKIAQFLLTIKIHDSAGYQYCRTDLRKIAFIKDSPNCFEITTCLYLRDIDVYQKIPWPENIPDTKMFYLKKNIKEALQHEGYMIVIV